MTSPGRFEGRDSSIAHHSNPRTLLHQLTTLDAQSPIATSLPHQDPAWLVSMPTPTAVNGCSGAIFVLCFAIFGYQVNGTIVVVDRKALAAVILASLASGAALFFGLMYKVHDVLACMTNHDFMCRDRARFVSLLIYSASCSALLLAGTSLSIFLVRVAWKTSPLVSITFFAAFGCTSLALFCLIVAHLFLHIRSSPPS